jgi:hypothetical protein
MKDDGSSISAMFLLQFTNFLNKGQHIIAARVVLQYLISGDQTYQYVVCLAESLGRWDRQIVQANVLE